MKFITNRIDKLYELLESFAQYKIGRFILGAFAGMFFAAIYWLYSYFFYVDVAIATGIIGSLILMLFCALVAAFGDFSQFIEDFNL